MKKITDIFKNSKRTLSFELFPPKTDQGFTKLLKTIGQLAALKPDFISCTYGAGGGNRDRTLEVVQYIQDMHNVTGLAHLTCVLHSKEEIKKRHLQSTIEYFLTRLSVSSIGKSYIISVEFESKNPKKAALIANTIIETYIEHQIEAKIEAAQKATAWLDERIRDLQIKVITAETAVEN